MTNMIINTIITVIITAVVTSCITYAVTLGRKVKALYRSQCSQLRIQIVTLGKSCTHKKFATVEEKDAIDKAYADYHTLGGNGTITSLYNEVMKLPLEENKY